ncbi:MAG: hypothetical protein K2X77_32435 [Candidatus Obscuribacterales bacterium]|jgi:hypothetical protein|nr:hypothetical protein [Candidatus Obscuribacterales bacterium]
MADETAPSGLEGKIAALNSKIERESRFTRSLIVICTAAILGVSLVPVKIMLTDLPTIMWAEFSEHLDTLHSQWKIMDRVKGNDAAPLAGKIGNPAASSTDAAAPDKKPE